MAKFNFDDLLSKAKTVANIAGQKTGEVVELSKLKLQAVQIGNDIQKAHERLGNIVYEQEKTGVDNSDLIAVCISEIDTLLMSLNEVNAKINDSKNTVQCKNCGASNPEGSMYCSHCGGSLVEREEPAAYASPIEVKAEEAEAPAEKTESAPAEEPVDQQG